jgi:hypothetical protein
VVNARRTSKESWDAVGTVREGRNKWGQVKRRIVAESKCSLLAVQCSSQEKRSQGHTPLRIALEPVVLLDPASMRAEPHRSLDAGKQTDSSWQEALSAPCESSGQRKLGGIAIRVALQTISRILLHATSQRLTRYAVEARYGRSGVLYRFPLGHDASIVRNKPLW